MSDKYIKLIEDVRAYYESGAPELRNIKNDDALFDLEWCKELFQEINLWNFWQGKGKEKTEIMIVGQDFGNCDPKFLKELFKRSGNAESASQFYIDEIKHGKSPTDKNLIKLTNDSLGKEYSAGMAANKHLFFTNLCLGYRSVAKISGGNMSAYLRHDSIYLKRLIGIKRPELIICLGADTYLAAITGLSDCYAQKDYEEYCKKINDDFWSLLDQKDNHRDFITEDYTFTVFGVSHTGSNGMINRKRLSKKHRGSNIKSWELMTEDWKNIAEYYFDKLRNK